MIGLELLGSRDPPDAASSIGMCHVCPPGHSL